MDKLATRLSRKRSYVWEHFRVFEEDNRKAICDHCGAHVHRGTNSKTFSTTPLICHLRRCKLNAEFVEPKSSKKQRYSSLKPNINATILIDKEPGSNDDDSDDEYGRQQLVHTPTHIGNSSYALADDDHTSYTPQQSDSTPTSMVHIKRTPITLTLSTSHADNYVSPDPRYDITDDVIQSKRMDLIHSGLVMHTLYQQHKRGMFCDLSLIVTRKSATTTTVAQNESIHASSNKTGKKTFKAHSSVLAALSSKIKTLVEMGSSSLEMKDVTTFGLRSLLEIVYTGKLKLQTVLKFHQAQQIWKAASDLGINYVQDYLVSEHPQVSNWMGEQNRTTSEDQGNFDDANDDLRDLCAPSLEESVVDQIVGEMSKHTEVESSPVKSEELVDADE